MIKRSKTDNREYIDICKLKEDSRQYAPNGKCWKYTYKHRDPWTGLLVQPKPWKGD